jgi:hypothetical protein
MTYIFGYGSLLYANGINGRGMKRIYTDDDLIPCILNGYYRAWNAVHNGIRYLGISPNPTSSINGVVFLIDKCDIAAFRKSECSSTNDPDLYTESSTSHLMSHSNLIGLSIVTD